MANLRCIFLPTKSGRKFHTLKNSLNNVFNGFEVPQSYVLGSAEVITSSANLLTILFPRSTTIISPREPLTQGAHRRISQICPTRSRGKRLDT